jgi:hypothetical protein
MHYRDRRYRRNADKSLRDLERDYLSGNSSGDSYFAALYRHGLLGEFVENEEGIGPASLWYWKQRFRDGYDVIFSVTNDSLISEGHECHGLTYNAVLQHPYNIEMSRSVSRPNYPLGQRIINIEWHYLKPVVKFYDPRYPALGDTHPEYRAPYDHLGQGTPGIYLVESLMSSSPLDELEIPHIGGKMQKYIERKQFQQIGLNFQTDSPSWSIDGPATAQLLEVLDHVMDGWIPPEPTPEYQELLEQLREEQKRLQKEKGTRRRNPARRFSREELDEIVDNAIMLQNDILGGRVTIDQALEKISGDIYMEEPQYSVGGTPDAPEFVEEQGITVKAEGEAFDRYMGWVSQTWDADKIVTKYVITMLGMPEKLARPAIVPHREDHVDLGHCGLEYSNSCIYCDDDEFDPYLKTAYVFRCETCNKPLLKGGIVMNNNLRCSVQCQGWWEK